MKQHHLKYKHLKHSAIVDHAISSSHSIGFDNFIVLHNKVNKFKRIILESIYINTKFHFVNHRTDFQNVNLNYVLAIMKCVKYVSKISL